MINYMALQMKALKRRTKKLLLGQNNRLYFNPREDQAKRRVDKAFRRDLHRKRGEKEQILL